MNEAQAAPDVSSVKPCCKDVANMVRTEDRFPWTTDTCQVCGCNHRRLDALGSMGPLFGVKAGGHK